MAEQKPIGTVYRCPVGPHEFTRPGHDPSNDARCEDHWGKMGARVRFEYPPPPKLVVVRSFSEPATFAVVTFAESSETVPVSDAAPEPETPPPPSFERFDALLAKVDEGVAHDCDVTPEPKPTPLPPLEDMPMPPLPSSEPKPPSPRTPRRRG